MEKGLSSKKYVAVLLYNAVNPYDAHRTATKLLRSLSQQKHYLLDPKEQRVYGGGGSQTTPDSAAGGR